MGMGFRPSNNSRQPIYGEQVSRKVGYVEHANNKIYFCDSEGKRIARVVRYHERQAPQPQVSLVSSYVPQREE